LGKERVTTPQTIAIIAGQLVVEGLSVSFSCGSRVWTDPGINPVILSLHPGHNDYWEDAINAVGVPLLFLSARRNRLFRLIEIAKKLRLYSPALVHGWHLFASPYAGGAAKMVRATLPGLPRGSISHTSKTRRLRCSLVILGGIRRQLARRLAGTFPKV